ncbi:hypothetical protein REPUB_Repub19eG0010200 [Reevesia pubescens]
MRKIASFPTFTPTAYSKNLSFSARKIRYPDDAQNLFDEMPNKDLVSWNSLISGLSRICSNKGALTEGKCIHGFAMKLGLLNEVKIVNAYINMYGKSGYLNEACWLFEAMPLQNLVSWNSMVANYTQNGLAEESMGILIMKRRAGVEFDQATVLTVLQACENLGVRNVAGRCLHASNKVFGEIIYLDRVARTAMLAGNSMHGYGKDAIKLFEVMVKKGVQPDHVTFTHLLSACSHSGLVNEGKHYFTIMCEVYRVEQKLDHYSCMVDLPGRSGLLNDAYDLIRRMPMEPNSGVLCALLAGLWREASKVRALMKERSLNRTPGCSFVEHGNKIHCFVVGDRSHPEAERIYNNLEELIGKITKTGFMSKTEFVLHDIDEVRENMINEHSEKLAMAFGLLVTDAAMPLIITKNLRICGDCHSIAKVVSLIEKRTIIIRDPKWFHHFSNGLCSCGDHCALLKDERYKEEQISSSMHHCKYKRTVDLHILPEENSRRAIPLILLLLLNEPSLLVYPTFCKLLLSLRIHLHIRNSMALHP